MVSNGLYRRNPPISSQYSRDIPTPVTYRLLSSSDCLSRKFRNREFVFVYESWIEYHLAAGACAAIYQRKIVLKDDDFNKNMSYVTQPRFEHIISHKLFLFILAASYLCPEENRQKIRWSFSSLDISIVKDLINDATKGKDGRRVSLF